MRPERSTAILLVALATVAWTVYCLFFLVVVLWFALPPGTLQFHFWTLLGVVSLVSLAWRVWPLLARPNQQRA
jgi:hypothetical protein